MSKHDPFAPGSAVRIGEKRAEEKVSTPAPVPDPKKADESSAAQTASAPVASEEKTATDVPAGTIKEVLEWVGDDEDRAQAAYDAELESDEPRSSLIHALEEKLA